MNLTVPGFIEAFRDLLTSGVIINPSLAGIDAGDRFDPGVFDLLDVEVGEIAASRWTEEEIISHFGALPVPDSFPRKALYETAAATAVFIAHEQTGYLEVDEKLALSAIERVKSFIEKHGLGILLLLFGTITNYENMNALAYYGKIPERTFLLGSWHRPWIDYTLSDELLMGVLVGNYQVVIEDGRRFVTLTEQGHSSFKDINQILNESGYFRDQLSLLHISQFNLFDEYEKLAEEIWPEAMPLRKYLLDWAGIKPGMKVLELGCGSGIFTFEGGLADRVGPEGRVIALDPSPGMLARARRKPQAGEYNWVEFIQGRAEDLPFADATFDAVIGSAFLHFTEHDMALREMRRVTRPGGIVASGHPLKYNFVAVPFFGEWFAPIFRLAAQRRSEPPRDFLLLPEDAPRAFEAAGLIEIEREEHDFPMLFHDPDKVVRHFIEGVGLFQEELASLPWKARRELIASLIENGVQVCKKYSVAERVVILSGQVVKGVVP